MSQGVGVVKESMVNWVGADVSKKTFDVALVTPGQHFPATALRELPVAAFARTQEGVAKCITWIERCAAGPLESVRIVMESTGKYSQELATWFVEQCPALAPAIVNPARTCAFIKSMGLRNKTDKLEARALAFYGLERRPKPYVPVPPAWTQLRELSRYRDSLVRIQVAQENQAEEVSACLAVNRLQAKRIRQTKLDIKVVEGKMRKVVADAAPLKRDVALLESIYGVGMLTAMVIVAELGDLRRFRRARQLTAFAGLSPQLKQSGTSIEGKAHLCKQGNPRVRQALYLAAMSLIRKRSHLQAMFQRLVGQGKQRMVALGAVMRKMLTVMRVILISGKPFEPSYVRAKTSELSCG